jgi:hypothetical protein
MSMKKYAMMLGLGAGMLVASQVAMAQADYPVANMPKECQELARKGFKIMNEVVTRTGTAATTPRPGSSPAPRKYGEAGNDKWFIDSFPAHPKGGCRVCGVSIGVKGTVGTSSLNNDSITVVGSNTAAPQISLTGTPHFDAAVHKKLGGFSPLPAGPYSQSFQIGGADYNAWYMNALVPWIDVMVQDDSSVGMIEVRYFYY